MTSIRTQPKSAPTLVHWLLDRTQAAPDRRIFTFADEADPLPSLNHAALDIAARGLAARLQQLGLQGERAVILLSPGRHYIATLLGCFYAGVIAVPTFPPRLNRPISQLCKLVTDAGARIALATADTIDRLLPQVAPEPTLADLDWIAIDSPAEVTAENWHMPQIDERSLALLQYTSGSTGFPKGVMVSHANLRDNVLSIASGIAASCDDRVVTWLPPYHDMGLVGGLMMPLFMGMDTVVLQPATFVQKPMRWLSAISEHRATISGGPNFGYELCIRRVTPEQRERLDLASWRIAICGAERVRPETMRAFARHFAISRFRPEALAPCYGLAEATLGVTLSTGLRVIDTSSHQEVAETAVDGLLEERASDLSVSCGKPFPGVDIRITDPVTREAVPEGATGEVWVRGGGIAQGYWNKAELTRHTFHALAKRDDSTSWLRTGDLGFLMKEELHVLGRMKDVIIIRGVNVYPEDVEALVERVDQRLRPGGTVALGIEHGSEEQLVIVQELHPGRQEIAQADLSEQVNRAVAEGLQLAVHRVVFVKTGAIPRTSSGKVMRRRCRELLLADALDVLYDSEAAGGASESASAEEIQRIATMMAEVLEVATVLPDEDFFWLGGHSLLATQLVSRIRDEMSVELSLADVFQASTPRRLAARIPHLPVRTVLPDIRRVDRDGPLPVTFSQERMWLLHQMDPAGTAYNVAGALQIEGRLDLRAFSEALSHGAAQHEMLRSRYRMRGGELEMIINPAAPAGVDLVDLTQLADPVGAALEAATLLARRPFDISGEPLARFALYRVGTDHHVLASCIHHLVIDAWSMGILVRDVMQTYEALVSDRPVPLRAPAIGLPDYASWQRSLYAGHYLDAQKTFWRETLQDAKAVELPTDFPRPRQRSSAGDVEPLVLPDELMDSVANLAKAHSVTPFMVLLAAFEVLLNRWTSATDLVVGVPVANRNWREAEDLVGTLVNTLPVRVRFDQGISFSRLMREVAARCVDAYANQDLPFERMIADMSVERKPGVSPLVSVLFDYQNTPVPGSTSAGISIEPLFLSRGSAQFDLSMLILDAEIGRIAGIEYSTELFDAHTIRRMGNHYLTLLECAVGSPHTPIDQLQMMDSAERADLVAFSRRTCCGEMPQPLLQRIEHHFAASPDSRAVQDASESLSYGALLRRVCQISALLLSKGVQPGSRVAVSLDRGVNMVASLLAVMRCGAAYIPLDPSHPRERLRHVLEDGRPALLLTSARHAADPVVSTLATVTIEEAQRTPVGSAAIVACDENLAAYIIYTSGSTGRPKGVEVSRRALANFIQSMQREPGLNAEDRLLSVTTVSFDIAGLEMWLPLAAGACLYVADAEVVVDGSRLARLLDGWEPTLMQATPATWKMLAEAGWRGSQRLRALCGGEAMPAEVAAWLLSHVAEAWNMYGPTETTIWSTLWRLQPGAVGVPIGVPIAETSVYILDAGQQLVPRGISGEIWIGGLGVANGYLGRPELTSERFLPDPFAPSFTNLPAQARIYRTGDAGRLRSDGTLEHLGRLDDQIKIRGFRIEPGEIEQVLKEQPGISDAVVLSREVAPGDMRLVAYYVPSGDRGVATTSARELVDALRYRLPAYMIPTAFEPLAALPRTPNNKIDRRALPVPVIDLRGSDAEYVPPRDAVESALVRIWSKLLRAPRVGVRDDFFMLGGHSLLAVRLFARIETRYGVKLPLATLFERPTIEHLAATIYEAIQARRQAPGLLGENASATARRYLVPIREGGTRPPFFCVHGAGGNVLNLWALSRRLGNDQPFYGLQARGVDGTGEPARDIAEMAREYLKEILLVQPRGTYYIGGYCAGGWVAVELARQLEERGETVALLALLDCYHPRLLPAPSSLGNILHGMKQKPLPSLLAATPSRLFRMLRDGITVLRVAVRRKLGRPMPLRLRDFWLINAALEAGRRYRPEPYDHAALLFRARDKDASLRGVRAMGWEGTLVGEVEVIDVQGDHHSLVEEPNVDDLAARLRARISTVSSSDTALVQVLDLQALPSEQYRAVEGTAPP